MLIMAQPGQDKPMKSGFRMRQLASSNQQINSLLFTSADDRCTCGG